MGRAAKRTEQATGQPVRHAQKATSMAAITGHCAEYAPEGQNTPGRNQPVRFLNKSHKKKLMVV